IFFKINYLFIEKLAFLFVCVKNNIQFCSNYSLPLPTK
ncbi:hypothetical protein M075_3158, partial [Bacteroides fragilis str. 20793-3]